MGWLTTGRAYQRALKVTVPSSSGDEITFTSVNCSRPISRYIFYKAKQEKLLSSSKGETDIPPLLKRESELNDVFYIISRTFGCA